MQIYCQGTTTMLIINFLCSIVVTTPRIRTACSDTERCKPGLKCNSNSVCVLNKVSCNYQLTSSDVRWKPTCTQDGVYSNKICKGEEPTGRCFCTNSTGGRIFGQEWWMKGENMTCVCSRRVSELQATGRKNVTLHCDQHGNYEELQCDSGVCWCTQPKTGVPTSRVVPTSLMAQLQCYSKKAVGDQYLRQCESQYLAVVNIREELNYHGTTMDSMSSLNCDQDGSYGSVQINSNLVYCKSWNNTLLSGQGQLSGISSMNCNCARDQLYFPASGKGTLPLSCQANGNYADMQYDNQRKGFCVDSDGYIIKYLTEDDYTDDYGNEYADPCNPNDY